MTRVLVMALAGLGLLVELPPPVRLTQGVVLERALAPGDTHRYEIELRAGQYLELLIEQRSVDVLQTLVGPDGRVVLETDGPAADIGPDPLAIVAPLDGVYELTVKESQHGTNRPGSSYELHVVAVGEPGPRDLLRVKTVQASADAFHRADAAPAAGLARYREALAGWEALGDRRMQMWTENAIGWIAWTGLDQATESEEAYRRSLAQALELRDDYAEAHNRFGISQALSMQGRLDEARVELERALSLHRAAGREDEAARVLRMLGLASAVAGEPQSALDLYQQALDIYQSLGIAWGEALVRLSMGQTYRRVGDPELALEQFQLALPALPSTPLRAGCITQIGIAHFQLGDRVRARAAYMEALGIDEKLENRMLEAETYLNLGDLHQEEGDLRGAAGVFASALAAFQSHAYPVGEGMAQCRLGEVQRRLGDRAAARAAFQAALAIAPRATPYVRTCAEAGLARVALDSGELDVARAQAEAALDRAESLRAGVVSQRLRAASLAVSQPLYELLIDILMRQHEARPTAGRDALAFDVAERARARSLLELLGEGRVDVRRGVAPEVLAEERSLRRRFNTAAAEQADAAAAGRAERAGALDRVLDSLAAQLGETEARIRRTSPQYAALTQVQPLTLSEIAARILDPETQLLEYALGETGSYLWVVSARRIDAFRLAPRAEIESAARRLHDLTARPPGSAGRDGAVAVEAAARDLSRLVLGPAAAAITARRLIVVGPGVLQYVPFAALPMPDGTPLLARFELVNAPSASVVAALRDEARAGIRPGKTAAIFADPVFEPSDPRLAKVRMAPGAAARLASRDGDATTEERDLRGVRGGLVRLPFSRKEADAIRALAAPGDVLEAIGFDASRPAATSPSLADYRIVHFATHGVLNTRQPGLSGVVLSLFDANGRRQDGFLRLHDIYNLKLSADLVVLSACQTALGREIRGEGLMGLTRGFMYAGARSVVASLWQVDDESTAELMKRFYRGMLKEHRRPADALRGAQLEMSRDKRWAAPFYWAGFVLQGEWR